MTGAEALHALQVAWRRCFVGALRPQHLPQGWSVEHAAYSRAWEGVHERLVNDGEFGRARVRASGGVVCMVRWIVEKERGA